MCELMPKMKIGRVSQQIILCGKNHLDLPTVYRREKVVDSAILIPSLEWTLCA